MTASTTHKSYWYTVQLFFLLACAIGIWQLRILISRSLIPVNTELDVIRGIWEIVFYAALILSLIYSFTNPSKIGKHITKLLYVLLTSLLIVILVQIVLVKTKTIDRKPFRFLIGLTITKEGEELRKRVNPDNESLSETDYVIRLDENYIPTIYGRSFYIVAVAYSIAYLLLVCVSAVTLVGLTVIATSTYFEFPKQENNEAQAQHDLDIQILRATGGAEMPKKKILILAANPKDTKKLRLDEEVREIDEGLRRSTLRDQFVLEQRWAVRIRDLRRALLDENPQIVHFSGHGAPEGLALEDNDGQVRFVNIDALSNLFKLFTNKVECVVLNACYSDSQAEAIHQHIPYVIGMRKAIRDDAAIEFAVGFYDAIGAGRSYDEAYEFGRNAIELQDIPETLTPFLHRREAAIAPEPKVSRATGRRHVRDVIILSCSAHKRSDGETLHPRRGGVSEIVANPVAAERAIQTRVQIREKILRGQIDGTEFQEGNRLGRPQNQALIFGPDFGGKINEARYLPAYWRYMGRTYTATREEWENFKRLDEDVCPSVLIISGLYGLIPIDEYIQNYDVHLTDRELGTEPSSMVREHWVPSVTAILLSHLDWLEASGWEIGRVIDLISERSYQLDIDWGSVYPRTQVLHRVFEHRAGRDALANIGVVVRNIIRDPSKLSSFEADKFYEEPDFIDPDRLAFETHLDASPLKVTRE